MEGMPASYALFKRLSIPEVIREFAVTPRRFPPPWIVEETDACFIVKDAHDQKLVYVYFEDELGRRAAAHLLTRDEARRIASNVVKLPELLSKP